MKKTVILKRKVRNYCPCDKYSCAMFIKLLSSLKCRSVIVFQKLKIFRCLSWKHWLFEVYLLCVINILAVLLFTRYQYYNTKLHAISLNTQLGDSVISLAQLLQSQEVKLCVVAPGILWDTLSDEKKTVLMTKGLKPFDRKDHNGLMSLALFQKDVEKVMSAYESSRLANLGFRTLVLRSQAKEWMNTSYVRNGFFISHVLLFTNTSVLHLPVFYDRGNFFWLSRMENVYGISNLSRSGLVYGVNDLAFDRFEIVQSSLANSTLFVPSHIPYFLWQMSTSRFVECLEPKSPEPEEGKDHVPMWFFAKTARSVVQEMTKLTNGSMVQFWLASGTLLGWYRQCGLIPYTHDMDFAAWAQDISTHLDQIESSRNIEILNMLGKISEDFELWLRYQWLRVDLFFTYVDKKQRVFYVGGHRPEQLYSFRYLFPSFTLCSGDFYGVRVLVPCDPEAVLAAEYGDDWRVPVSDWNYEISARNVMGRRYWTEDEGKRVHQFKPRLKKGQTGTVHH